MKMNRKRLFAVMLVFVLVMIATGCGSGSTDTGDVGSTTSDTDSTAEAVNGEESGLHVLTLDDVKEIYNPAATASFKDETMAEAVSSGASSELNLTEEEKEKIRGMNLKIGLEQDHLDDAMKLIQQAFKDQCADLNIDLSDIWVATDMDGASQMDDYQNFLAMADQYDGFFTCLSDASINSDLLKQIMKKCAVGTMLAAPYDLDWSDPQYVGITDINAKEAGIQSAKAAIKILGESGGSIGTIGYENGHNGSINTCYQRYIGWDEVFAENSGVTVHQAWYDNPADSKSVISSLLASNPDIKVLLVDWSYPPADNAMQVCHELGLKAGQDISIVAIDYDNVVTIPMASQGNGSYCSAAASQRWYDAGANLVKMYARYILDEGKNVKFVASNPAPLTTPMDVKTNFRVIVPETVDAIPMPDEINALTDQWTLEDLGAGDLVAQ